jgi:competence protein ComEC
MASPRQAAVPLIAKAYVAFVAGLFTGFAGIAWIAVAIGICAIAYGGAARRSQGISLSLMLVGGAIIALTSARPEKRRVRQEIAAETGVLETMHRRAAKSIERLFGSDAPMAKALLIADQQEIPPEIRDRYARSGMVHMLSISGLHVAIVAGAMMLVLQAMHLSRGMASLVGVVLTFCYVAVIGAPPPAVRSATMLAVVAASKCSQRPTSQWAALAVGAFVPLASPRTVLDLGYQLSVVGIAGLIASGALAKRLLAPRLDGGTLHISRELLTSIVATVVTAPLIAWYFGRLSLIAPLANLAAAPVISILQPTLFLALALAPIRPLASLIADAAHPLLKSFDLIASVASSVPMSSIEILPSLMTVILGGIAVIALISACVSRYPARSLITSMSFISLAMFSPAVRLPYRGDFEMHVLDVGQGDAILLRTDRGRWIVVDAGRMWKNGDAGKSTILPYIRSRGGEVEALIISHAHADHIGGAVSVLHYLHPDVFWDAAFAQGSQVYATSLREAESSGTRWRRVHPGDTMRVDGVLIRFLAPDSAWTSGLNDPNEASTVASVEFGSTHFLLMGDAERDEEAWLMNHASSDLRADVLKVGHHGSSTSSTDAFLAAVEPSLAVISVGADNLYGHPSADVLASLSRIGARIVRTDQAGTIVVHSDGNRLTYEAKGETWDISQR